MAEILKGAPVANSITEKVAQEAAELKAKGVTPTLAIVRAGDNPDDITYERAAMKRAEKAGVEVLSKLYPADISEAELLDEIDALNKDDKIHGILMMQPLPEQIDDAAADRKSVV